MCMYDTHVVMSYQHTWCSDVICLLKQLRPEVNSHSASFWTQVVLPANVLPRRHSLMGQGGSNGCPVQGWNTHTTTLRSLNYQTDTGQQPWHAGGDMSDTHCGWSGNVKQTLNHVYNDAVVCWWSCDVGDVRWLPHSHHQLTTPTHTPLISTHTQTVMTQAYSNVVNISTRLWSEIPALCSWCVPNYHLGTILVVG